MSEGGISKKGEGERIGVAPINCSSGPDSRWSQSSWIFGGVGGLAQCLFLVVVF